MLYLVIWFIFALSAFLIFSYFVLNNKNKNNNKLKIVLSQNGAVIPSYATPGSNGLDLTYSGNKTIELYELGSETLETGIKVEIPKGYVGLVCPRSGLAFRQGVTLINSPGVIDEDYRGEIKIKLINLGNDSVFINPGERIAQLLVIPQQRMSVEVVDKLPNTERNQNGFGSTGK